MSNFNLDGILGGLVAALIIFLLYQTIRRRNRSGDIPKGTNQDWLLIAGILGGVLLFVYLLIKMV